MGKDWGGDLKLSVITVSWADPGGLERTLSSLLPLTERSVDFEHVVVSDRRPVVPPGWPLRWLPESTRAGIFPAMNRGITASLGQALWFLNGGDTLYSASALDRALPALAVFDGVWMGARMMEHERYCYTHHPKDFEESIEGGRFPCHQAFLYRREMLSAGFPELDLGGDEAHFLQLYQQKRRVIPLDLELVEFDGTGRSQRDHALRFEELERWYRTLELPSRPLRQLQFHLRRRQLKAWAQETVRRVPLANHLRPLWWKWLASRGGYG